MAMTFSLAPSTWAVHTQCVLGIELKCFPDLTCVKNASGSFF